MRWQNADLSLYGIFHAVGHGHGKAVISSYVLATGERLRQATLTSVGTVARSSFNTEVGRHRLTPSVPGVDASASSTESTNVS
ncbi:hypothetical protein [Rhizobium sp. P28RR-XV]|uniref:HoxN/HupN/NixA family nickel/cobalt transporter n=1 Tax=Rhizobium sp. P28RR-XV TaxID=2726737 RepID=UPI0019817B91|nr:hypothetical protein [Rhizobium sp. P28RR-XV]